MQCALIACLRMELSGVTRFEAKDPDFDADWNPAPARFRIRAEQLCLFNLCVC